MAEFIEKAGFKIVQKPLRNTWNPTSEALLEAREYGRLLAKA
jgi:flavorubredoxin